MTSPQEQSAPKAPSPALEAWIARRDRLKAIEIRRTLEALGANPNQDRQRNKWKIPGVGNIITKGQTWLNGNLQLSGYGSVSLVCHALGFEKDTEAMKWLAERFPDELEGEWIAPSKDEQEYVERAFTPPERVDGGLDTVASYLIDQRGLPPSLITREITAGRVYSTQNSDRNGRIFDDAEPQCVFIGPSSAEIRSTDPDGFKGCCDGSDSERSGYQVMFQEPAEKVVAITEAAIDALSYHALFPHRFAISTNGAGRFELQYKITLEAYRNGFATHWALDADETGDIAVQRLFNALVLRDRLSQELGVSPEQIDEWLITKKILSVPQYSAHEIFLKDPSKAEHPVFVGKKTVDSDGKVDIDYVDTQTTQPSTITYSVPRAAGVLKRATSVSFTLSPAEIEAVMASYRTVFQRPEGAKDWNEVLKTKGPSAVRSYESEFSPSSKRAHADHPVADPAPSAPTPPSASTKVSRFARQPVRSPPAPDAPSGATMEFSSPPPPRFRR